MCGICGIIYRDSERPVDIQTLKDMSRKISHRGPDDEGFYTHQNVGLASKRLSIIDIKGGHQPILNEDESVVVVYNGEIYNYLNLKKELEGKGHKFRTRCDTEVLIHLYEEYGKEMVNHLNGMFVFAIYDRRYHRLLLARDRLGIKPFYYIVTKDWILFGSEIKSFLAFRDFNPGLDFEALHHYLTFRFVPAPKTLFKGVKKLPPGYFIEYVPGHEDPSPMMYWDLTFNSWEKEFSKTQSTEAVRELTHEAVKNRLMSEVPLGVMLSGGIDSSAVVSSMKKGGQHPVSTFTIAYEEEGPHNEGVFARITAEAFQTDHHDILVRLDDFIGNLEQMIYFMDEPIADPAAMPIYDLCRFSKEHVTVLLSGVGGDELFGGYDVYKEAIYSGYLRHIPRFFWNNFILPIYNQMPEGMIGKNYARRIHKPIEEVFLGSSTIYGGFSETEKASLYTRSFAEQQSAFNSHNVVQETLRQMPGARTLQKMMYIDTKHWLADSHLIMMDKMSMANSIELRTPLLDHRLVELAASIPEKYKLGLFKSKIIFKNAFKPEIPKPILTRPKRGFSTPINIWLNRSGGVLREILLKQKSLTKDIFQQNFIDRLLDKHKKRQGDFSASIFTLLVLDLWLATFLDNN